MMMRMNSYTKYLLDYENNMFHFRCPSSRHAGDFMTKRPSIMTSPNPANHGSINTSHINPNGTGSTVIKPVTTPLGKPTTMTASSFSHIRSPILAGQMGQMGQIRS